ncbi:MAG: hypothetical protein KatS3mg065_0700 [Chloroflexota bacterium]|nr:MAG: hypothetical protein KatS3mg065_0700 [Chloroflexota bacterium]
MVGLARGLPPDAGGEGARAVGAAGAGPSGSEAGVAASDSAALHAPARIPASPGPAAVRATVRDPGLADEAPRVVVEPEQLALPGDPPSAVVDEADGEGGRRRTRWALLDHTAHRLRAVAVESAVAAEAGAEAGPDAAAEAGEGERASADPAAKPDPARIDALLGPVQREPDGRAVREVVVDGWRFLVEVEPARRAALRERARRSANAMAHGGPSEVRAAIPGRVVAVAVAEGDRVTVGSDLLVVEAMKMQNEVRSPRDGVVRRIAVGVGQSVELGDLLVVIE